jgi:toxin ParE1/3/4
MNFLIKLDLRALKNIQNAIDYYDDKQIGLGKKFEAYLNKHFKSLSKNPFYQYRYDNLHCLP